MIQKLIQHIIDILKEGFSGIFSDPEGQIQEGLISPPSGANLPEIAVYSDKLEFCQQLTETGSSQPRPEEFRQEIAVSETDPAGPYPLAKQPLQKSTLCTVFYDQGNEAERQISLTEDKDFTINYEVPPNIVFSYDISGADLIRLRYSFVGVFTVREFQQDFLVDVFDSSMNQVEEWASLATAMILTNHDKLVEKYNLQDQTQYNTQNTENMEKYNTSHTITRINLLEALPERADNSSKLQLRFQVQGQIKTGKDKAEFGLIEKIHSPGKIPDQPVDIDIEVE